MDKDAIVIYGWECYVYYSRADRLWLYSGYKNDHKEVIGHAPSRDMALVYLTADLIEGDRKNFAMSC